MRLKLFAIFISLVCCHVATLHAADLGAARLLSSENESLELRINLAGFGEIDANDVIIRFASAEIYSRLALRRDPFLNDVIRRKMGDQALKLARLVDYSSAGTVEFLVDEVTRLMTNINSCTSVFSQMAAISALEGISAGVYDWIEFAGTVSSVSYTHLTLPTI